MQSELQQKIKKFILDSKIGKEEEVERSFAEAEKTGRKFGDILIEKKIVSGDKLAKISAYVLEIPFINLNNEEIPQEVLGIIPEPIAREHNIVACKKKGDELIVAMLDPEDLQTIEFIKRKTGLRVFPHLATKEAIKNVIKQYQKSLQAEFEDLVNKKVAVEKLNIVGAEKDTRSEDRESRAYDLPIVNIVDTLLSHAVSERASDIHIEPEEKDVLVRYRVDGVLKNAMVLPKPVYRGIVARIKVLANLKPDEHRLPQDGRFKIEGEDYKFSFRVAVLPVFDGEKIVMRLLNDNLRGLSLEKLGFWGKALQAVRDEIEKPHGIILVAGPAGSGKTATLYSVLEILNTPDVNINTIEDPVEYRMARVNQTQVRHKIGLSFASGLRALLRQDPDVVMIGEIRDEETAEMAIHAALIGRLVLSTLHTDSAAATLIRLADLKIEPFLIAGTFNAIIAQRLARRLCPDCREKYRLDKTTLNSLAEKFKMDKILSVINNEKISGQKKWETVDFWKPRGCERCHNEGYKGRIGIYEVLRATDGLRMLISKGASAAEIEEMAFKEGMISMIEDGFVKAVKGDTSLEEILRVMEE